ncbi:MAG: hypothetical protein GVY16_08935 [Planctomycetes bacterium]|nr:hypothetical protein [Planctomycetota bacterium]
MPTWTIINKKIDKGPDNIADRRVQCLRGLFARNMTAAETPLLLQQSGRATLTMKDGYRQRQKR